MKVFLSNKHIFRQKVVTNKILLEYTDMTGILYVIKGITSLTIVIFYGLWNLRLNKNL